MSKYFSDNRKMIPAGDGGDGGGGAGDDKNKPDPAKELADLKAKHDATTKELEALKAKSNQTPDPKDDDLVTKARLQREADDKKNVDSKSLEAAIRFGLKSDEFLKTNAAILPKDIADIFKAAEKENYSNAIEKDSAIKSGLIQSFFQVQSNKDMLTSAQQIILEDYFKLTKTGKQDKAQQIYDSIFEPTFEMAKKLKKAEALSKGYGGGSSTEDAYKTKLMGQSKKHYLGEKQ